MPHHPNEERRRWPADRKLYSCTRLSYNNRTSVNRTAGGRVRKMWVVALKSSRPAPSQEQPNSRAGYGQCKPYRSWLLWLGFLVTSSGDDRQPASWPLGRMHSKMHQKCTIRAQSLKSRSLRCAVNEQEATDSGKRKTGNWHN